MANIRFNESGSDAESLPFGESKSLAHTWIEFLDTHDRLLFDTWEITAHRYSLGAFDADMPKSYRKRVEDGDQA